MSAMVVALVFYFYPRPPRGGRPKEITAEILAIGISIHALREEGDLIFKDLRTSLILFLSTPSARRATRSTRSPRQSHGNFYPRPPRGGRPASTSRPARS